MIDRHLIEKKLRKIEEYLRELRSVEGVDDTITYSIYKNHLNDFKKFISSIREFIKK